MKPTRLFLFALVALCALLFSARFLFAVKTTALGDQQSDCLTLEAEEINQRAPDFTLTDINGRKVHLADHRGQVVLLNFWATWCPPCVEELPSLARVNQLMKGKPFTLITVSVDQNAEEVKAFLSKQSSGVKALPVALDPAKKVPASYGTEKFPETFLIDREGIIRYKMIFKRDWSSPAALSCLESIL